MAQTSAAELARSNKEELFRADLVKVLETKLAPEPTTLNLSLGEGVKILADLTVGMKGNTFEPCFHFLEQDIVLFRVASLDSSLSQYFRRARISATPAERI